MLTIASHFPSATQLKWGIVGFGVMVVGSVLFLQQAQVAQLRQELNASRNEVTLVRTSEARTTEDNEAGTVTPAKNTPESMSKTGNSEQASVADGNNQPIAQNSGSSGGGTPASEHPDGCDCPIHAPTSIVGSPTQQTSPTSSQQSQTQQSDGLVPSLLGGVGGLVGGLL